jgi:hypothetical protein
MAGKASASFGHACSCEPAFDEYAKVSRGITISPIIDHVSTT